MQVVAVYVSAVDTVAVSDASATCCSELHQKLSFIPHCSFHVTLITFTTRSFTVRVGTAAAVHCC